MDAGSGPDYAPGMGDPNRNDRDFHDRDFINALKKAARDQGLDVKAVLSGLEAGLEPPEELAAILARLLEAMAGDEKDTESGDQAPG